MLKPRYVLLFYAITGMHLPKCSAIHLRLCDIALLNAPLPNSPRKLHSP